MGWIECVRCEKLQHDFVARTFAIMAPVHPVSKWISCSYETIPNAPKYYKGLMGWIGCVRCKKSRRHFVARTLALIAPIHPILHRVSCSYEMIPNAPKHYETHPNRSLGSNWVYRVLSLPKLPMRFHATMLPWNFATNAPDAPHWTPNSSFDAFRSVWVHLGPFRYCMKLGAKRAEMVQLMQ